MKRSMRLLALLLCMTMLLGLLTGCGKSEQVKSAEALIEAIGEVTADSEEAVAAAEAAFAALTAEEKAKVENASKLTEARTALNAALAEALIGAIGEVTADSEEAVAAAEEAFAALTEEEKALVGNADALADARHALNAALAAEKIEAIGEVGVDSEEAIAAAEEAFEALSEEEKALVGNADVLADARHALAAAVVAEKIEAIGEVGVDSEELIAAAEEAYEALSEEEKALVPNADVLPAAREALAAAELEALKQALIGSWETKMELIDLMAEVIDSQIDDARISYRDYLDSFAVVARMEFREDDSYHLWCDPDSLEDAMASVKSATVDYMHDYLILLLSDTLAEEGIDVDLSKEGALEDLIGMSFDDVVAASFGTDLAGLVDAFFGEEVYDTILKNSEREGRFTVEPGKLHLSVSPNAEPKEGDYEAFTLEGDTLTLESFAGTSTMGELYPIVFTRK